MNMKKWIALLLAALFVFTGCSKQETAAQAAAGQADSVQVSKKIDVDLTQLSSTMAYSEIYNILSDVSNYIGKTIRMSGSYSAFMDPETETTYHVCIITDTTSCCAQGVEFVLTDDNYPELESEITILGTFETYLENGTLYCHLADATLV